MKVNMTTVAAAMSIAVPAVAQMPVIEPTVEPVTNPAPDAERIAAAAVTIDALFPVGSYERMMRGTMDKMMDSILSSVTGMTPRQMGVDDVGDAADVPLGEIVAAEDPDFEERMRLSTKVMMNEMVDLMTEVEPAVRIALTRSFARRYSVEQLGEMNAFFATPTGSAFARDYLMTFTDPEMMDAMQAFVPRMMERMPAIAAKVEAATSHLPPPPGRNDVSHDVDPST